MQVDAMFHGLEARPAIGHVLDGAVGNMKLLLRYDILMLLAAFPSADSQPSDRAHGDQSFVHLQLSPCLNHLDKRPSPA